MSHMRTSQEWWNQVKENESELISWLHKQYHGEITAHARLQQFVKEFPPENPKHKRIIEIIAGQEFLHAEWISELLRARGEQPELLLDKPERYWDEALLGLDSFEHGAAIAAHAEKMRLHRITVIASDETAPDDIRTVFRRILPQEKFHANAFSYMAGELAMAQTKSGHERAQQMLGLIA